jgi:carboxyl-terminal processing protease
MCSGRAACVAGLVALTGCGSAEPNSPSASAPLFAHALDEIGKLYIRPVSGQALVAAGAAHLSAVDPAFTAATGPDSGSNATLVMSYDSRTIGSLVMPEGSDPEQLGALLASVVATARGVSPRIGSLAEDQAEQAVFNGITGALDRFSRYSPPGVARELRDARNGFGGVGVTLDSSNDEFRVTALDPRGPAERAGLRPGDRITAIDGIATARHSRAWVIEKMRGPVGSLVSLTIARSEPDRTEEFSFRRDRLILPTVTVARDGAIAVFHIASFNQSTTKLIADTLEKAAGNPAERIDGIVLDLRGDPGGLLEQAVSLADLFIRDGPIIATVGRHRDSHQYFAATGHGIAPRVPIVVLINGGSASAAEIVAAALQDVGRAVVVGSASFGKGTVQTVLRLANDGELTLTWARLIAPSGYLLEAHGVVPTLCTSDLSDNPDALALALQRVQAGSAASPLSARPRAGLDENGWTELRRSCRPRLDNPPVDLALAQRILSNPALYAAALRWLPPATTLVRAAPDTPSGLALTGPDRALSSGPH